MGAQDMGGNGERSHGGDDGEGNGSLHGNKRGDLGGDSISYRSLHFSRFCDGAISLGHR